MGFEARKTTPHGFDRAARTNRDSGPTKNRNRARGGGQRPAASRDRVTRTPHADSPKNKIPGIAHSGPVYFRPARTSRSENFPDNKRSQFVEMRRAGIDTEGRKKKKMEKRRNLGQEWTQRTGPSVEEITSANWSSKRFGGTNKNLSG